jgi:pantothenate kinase
MLEELARRAAALAENRRAILGIAGCPGAGKSTLAERLIAQLDPASAWVVRLPMDGFHLADAALERLGLRARKGAIETFDAYGYLAMLRRVQTELDHTVYAPDFHRTLEQPLAGSIAIDPRVRLVITEGNYLLCPTEPWPLVREQLAETWYVELDDHIRRDRLFARHVRFGKTDLEARRWVNDVDEANARLIAPGRIAADLRVDMSEIEACDEAGLKAQTGRPGEGLEV